MALFGSRRPAINQSAARTDQQRPDCVRDCFGAGEWVHDVRAAPMKVPLWGNPRATPLRNFSAACLEACACFFVDAFGGSGSRDGAVAAA